MKRFFKLSQISLFAGIFLTSCLGSKFLKDDEQLLAKQKINGLSGSLQDDAKGLYQQQPNSRILFGYYPFTHLAHLYQLGKNGGIFKGYDQQKAMAQRDSLAAKFDRRIAEAKSDKKRQKLRNKKAKKYDKRNRKVKQGNQLMRWGEPLAIYNHNSSKLTAEQIQLYLNSRGYFDAEIALDTANYDSLHAMGKFGRNVRDWVSGWAGKKDRYINLEYHVELNTRYVIDSIQYDIADTVLQALIFENIKDSPMKKGYYDQEMLTEERDFIYDLAVNNGYYEFSKQYIGFQLDSIQMGPDTLIVREVINNPSGKSEHKIFYLDSVVFVTDASVSEHIERTQEKYRDITFSFGKNRYSKKVLEWRVPLEQDDPYSRDLTIETQRQLSYLDNFKFININYDTTGNYFVANIFTSPFAKYQTSSEFGLSRTQGKPGPFVNINLKNRNTFRTLEILSLDANAKLEDLRSVREQSNFDGNYTSRQFGAEAAITFPQFLFPLGSYYKNKIGSFNPKTRLSLGFSFEDRVNEYKRLTYRGTWAYSWQVRDQVRYTLTPLQLSLTDATTSSEFQNFLDSLTRENNPYALAFQSAIVSSTAFQLDLSLGDYVNGGDGGFVRFNAELGGNVDNVLGNSLFGDNLESFRYAKSQIDIRKIERLARKTNLAARLNVGLAYPYGSNQAMPYEKYFFAGGSSSIRAWKPRRLGPGAFGVFETDENDNPTEFIDYDNEQRGELIIESSIELRQDLVGFLEGALFVDAGNIWQVRKSLVGQDAEGDDGIFRFNEFMKEMAVGAGVGLRFDLQFLIFRVDLGMKVFDPAQPRGKRYVGNQIFSNFGRNSEINIGIGYPF
ncbi:MAG: BamA/TamA family outer membrane protein [Ekhidna sp.]|uniref:translocation and assembly module lipoprotein TamL n=1 Tax=Ekhidna sp. TaxID=2608089 RepID=UPI0032EBFEB9